MRVLDLMSRPALTVGRETPLRAVKLALVIAALAAAGSSTAAPASPRTGRGIATTPVAVYLVRGERVAPVRRFVTAESGVARATLAALLRGATAAERKSGYSSAVPAGTRLRSVTVEHGLATIDLTGRFASGGGSVSMQLRVAQVVHTATQFRTIARVAFRIDGRAARAIGGEGVLVWPPVTRGSFEAQAPAILVERPLPGDVVRAPIDVRGTANVFEARLMVDLHSSTGTLLVHRPVSATSGTGRRGTFATALSVSGLMERATAVVYALSPKNGSKIGVVRVPVTLLPAGFAP